ncbi:MAG: porin [Mesosutterella sp.]|nr:porin [Mesosutterella sp.]
MKKTLIATAFLGAFAASAFAVPSVSLYGRIDTGLLYQHVNPDAPGKDSVDTVSMESGWNTGSRWGLKGGEDIGNVRVGFVLESGFASDAGTSSQGSRLFGRQATVEVSGAYGTLYAGRLGSINSDIGTIGLLGSVSPLGSSFSALGTHNSSGHLWTRYDNTLAYVSPSIAGLKAEAMYSFKGNTKDTYGVEGKSSADRYAAAGLNYNNGALDLVLTGDYTMWGNAEHPGLDDGWSVVLGGNYNFGFLTAYAKATYFDNQLITDDSDLNFFGLISIPVKGWGVSASVKAPLCGGSAMAEVGYRDAKNVDDSSDKFQRLYATVGYSYSFSKRTSVYVVSGYTQEKAKKLDRTPNAALVGGGLVHKF